MYFQDARRRVTQGRQQDAEQHHPAHADDGDAHPDDGQLHQAGGQGAPAHAVQQRRPGLASQAEQEEHQGLAQGVALAGQDAPHQERQGQGQPDHVGLLVAPEEGQAAGEEAAQFAEGIHGRLTRRSRPPPWAA